MNEINIVRITEHSLNLHRRNNQNNADFIKKFSKYLSILNARKISPPAKKINSIENKRLSEKKFNSIGNN